MTTSWPNQQRGVSMWGWLIILILVIFFGILTVKVMPVYVGYFKVGTTVEQLMNETQMPSMSRHEVKTSLRKRFDISRITAIDSKDLSVSKSSNQIKIKLDYTVKKHLFFNISVLMHFKKTYTKQY